MLTPLLALAIAAMTAIAIVTIRHLVHQARERRANDEAAVEWFRMSMRNGGLLTAACQELWGKLLEAWLNDAGGYDANAAQLLEEFVVRCRALVRRRTNRDPLVYLAWTTRGEMLAAQDLLAELRQRGIRLSTPHGEAADGRRLLYAKVALPAAQPAMGGFSVPLPAPGRAVN